jgi:hypothetical protein
MVSSDTHENTRIIYLYIRSFEWIDPMDTESKDGHPMVGKVYRTVHNKDTNSYRLIYEKEGVMIGIYLPKLTVTAVDETTKEPGYKANIEEITIKNILDFNLSEEDLDNIIAWQTNKQFKDEIGLKKKKEEKPTQEITPATIINAVQQHENKQVMANMGDRVLFLRERNTPLFSALQSLLDYLVEQEGENQDLSWLEYNKDLGAGTNISTALRALIRYSGEDRRTNQMYTDLLEAIRAIMCEAARKEIHGIL